VRNIQLFEIIKNDNAKIQEILSLSKEEGKQGSLEENRKITAEMIKQIKALETAFFNTIERKNHVAGNVKSSQQQEIH
jgi:hypothetical protein